MKKPNFFILGAPKCGTTSLADWLRDHDNIFVSDPKEPHYFNSDSDHHGVFSLRQYEGLFEDANNSHRAVGEASVWYLVSETAIDNILDYQPDAKFIVCLRNPVEASVSLHDQKVFTGDEPLTDFSAAWCAQEGRANGSLRLPSTCMDKRQLMYGSSCEFGRLLNRVYSKLAQDRVLVILMDDIRADPRAVYLKCLEFLGVNDDGRMNFERSNPAKQRKAPWISKVLRFVTLAKYRLGAIKGTGLGAKLNAWNQIERVREDLSPEIKRELIEYFRDDVKKLSGLLERDLSYWLRETPSD